ncbi:glycoside-pentoside-hexuronide (GPH):cation symporter [Marinibactrum halimedae]|uniref:Inner membrane symporter YicJ n=1 Tax=Marinibactrum halimedae TaxID=1444977 RepID=A0AA37WMW7_9GAMM|nr:glycoside-pentoside-hexuronide (GPH):cation symporter [Marinibactrum halimedae]MCD9460342.1 glycoside-pentoside-hexuronide (GPH):cation symporter [Marinibactrum halimedae]GLS26778.1 inner membrane symporter YicJ [Marinibactrum halimedae]
MAQASADHGKLTVVEKIGYGLGDTASNIVFQVVINFMVIFYTDVYGLPAATVGTLMLAVRVFDAFTDPLMGGMADRTKTRWGRYRPYLIYTSIPYGILAVFAFTTPDLAENSKVVYAYVTYALLMTAYTAVNIPYSALGGVITGDSTERASVQSYRFAMAMVGGALVTSATLPLVSALGGEDVQRGYQLAMAVLATLAVACFIGCFFLTRERITPPPQEKSTNIMGDLWAVMCNKQWQIIGLLAFFLLVLVAMRGAGAPFYMKYFFGREDLTSQFMTLGMIGSVVGALSTNFLTKLYCKVSIMNWALIGMIVFHALLFFVPNTQIELAFVFFILANMSQMVVVPLMFSMVPDTVDYGRLSSSRNVMAMSYSAHLLLIKMGLAIGGALVGWLLSYYNYEANAEQQSAQALFGIQLIFALSSVVCSILCLVAMRFYKLTNAKMVEIHAELSDMEAEQESESNSRLNLSKTAVSESTERTA